MADLCMPSPYCSLLMAVGKKGRRDDSRLLLDTKNAGKINKQPMKEPTLLCFL